MKCVLPVGLGRSFAGFIPGNILSFVVIAAWIMAATCSVLLPAPAGAQTVGVGTSSGLPGTAVDLSIGFSAGAQGIATLQFDLTLPYALTPVSTLTGAAAVAAGKSASGSASSGGMRILIFGLNQNAIGSGEVAVVRLTIAAGTPASSLEVTVGNIVASDALGNNVAASGTGGSVVVTAPTGNVPPVISSVFASGITQTDAIISWATDKPADSQIDFGATSSYGSFTALNTSMVTSHYQIVSGLLPGTTYHFRVKSKDAAGNLADSGDNSFTTSTTAPSGPIDTTPPVITGVTASNVTNSSATISWATNEDADTQVDYGLTTSYGSSTALNASLVTSHSQTLSGLTPATLYHYRVRSSDGSGNLSVSNNYTFTTTGGTGTVLFYPRMLTKDVAEAGSPDQEYTGIGIANLNNETATLRFSAYNSNGVLISGPGITNPATRQLKPGEQLPIMDQELFGAGVSGQDATGWVKIESDVTSVTGIFLMFNGRLSELDGADMYSTPVMSFVFPEVNDNGFTKINIGNPNATAATLTFCLFRSGGSLRAVATRTIPANGALVADLFADIFPGSTVDASDYVKVTSSQAVLPYQVMGKFEPGMPAQDLQSLHGQDASAGAMRLYCPQYILGDIWRSTVSLVNLDMATGDVSISFIGEDGIQIGTTRVVPIDSLGKIRIDDPRFFEPSMPSGGRQGYLLITANGIRLTGSVVFGDAARQTHATALPLVSSLDQAIVFSHVSSNDKYYTGVAIVNPNSSEAHVTLQLFNGDGSLGASTMVTIPAGRRISTVLTELFPDLAGIQLYAGYFQLTSDVGVASFAVFGSSDLKLLSAIPPQPQPVR
jgi:hypothetical protein